MTPDEFREIHGLLTDLKVGQGRMDERQERIESDIRGNGQPGIMQRLGDVELTQARYEGSVKDRDRIYGIVATAITGIGVFIEWLYHRGGGR